VVCLSTEGGLCGLVAPNFLTGKPPGASNSCFAREANFCPPIRSGGPNRAAESLSINHPPRPDGSAAYNIEKRFRVRADR
jgi:hypothetical protein